MSLCHEDGRGEGAFQGRTILRRRKCFSLWIIFVMIPCASFFWAANGPVLAVELPTSGGRLSLQNRQSNENRGEQFLSPAEIAEKIKEIKERLRLAKAAEGEPQAEQMGASPADLQKRIAKLRATQTVYERILTALKKRGSLEEEEAQLRKNLQTQDGTWVAQRPPYSLSFYDSLMDELAAAEQQKGTTALAMKLARKALEEAALGSEKARKEWRNLRDKVEGTPETDRALRLPWDLEEMRLEKDLREGIVHLEKVEIENLSKQVKIFELRADLSRRKANWVRDHLYFDQSDLAKQTEALERRRETLKKRVENLIELQERMEEEWLVAREEKKVDVDDQPAGEGEAFLQEQETWRKTYQGLREQTEDMLSLLGIQEQLWRVRYGLVKGETAREALVSQKNEIEDHVKNMNRLLSVQQSYQTSAYSQVSVLEKKISEQNVKPSLKPYFRRQVTALERLTQGRLEYISALLLTENMAGRALDEINRRLERVSIEDTLAKIMGSVQKIWDFEVWAIDNRPVTVRKLIVALCILVIGIFAAKYFLRAIGRRLLYYTHFKESTVLGIQKLFLYFIYLIILLFALRMVNIPLEAFAFLGGAIAIGIGFGAQNLINNFISGFIIMGERPISIGNIVEVEGVLGQIEEVGVRCTRIRTGENIHILVPNSSFLEKNITNWTLSDHKIRAHVTVGVRYGSPVREVERLLLEAVRGKERILDSPEPFVLFNDFGDNALTFQVHFWISITRIIERRLIESSVRFRIDDLLRDAGIVIAFPQRDVHLDTEQPLELRIIEQKKSEIPPPNEIP